MKPALQVQVTNALMVRLNASATAAEFVGVFREATQDLPEEAIAVAAQIGLSLRHKRGPSEVANALLEEVRRLRGDNSPPSPEKFKTLLYNFSLLGEDALRKLRGSVRWQSGLALFASEPEVVARVTRELCIKTEQIKAKNAFEKDKTRLQQLLPNAYVAYRGEKHLATGIDPADLKAALTSMGRTDWDLISIFAVGPDEIPPPREPMPYP